MTGSHGTGGGAGGARGLGGRGARDSLASERTWLAQRRTLLGLLVNAALLFRLPPLGIATGALVVLVGAASAVVWLRRSSRVPPVLAPTIAVVTAGVADLVTVLVGRR